MMTEEKLETPAAPDTAELKRACDALAVAERPRNSLGRFCSPSSKTAEEQRRENAQQIIANVQELLLHATEEDLKPKPEDSLNLLLIKTLVKNARESDPNKTMSGSVKLLETLHKSAGVYEKQDPKNNQGFTVLIVDPWAGLTQAEREEAMKNAVEYRPIVRKTKPSWAESEVVDAVNAQNVIEGEYQGDAPDSYRPKNPRRRP